MMTEPKIEYDDRGNLGPFVGTDGFAMLALSCLVIVCSSGFSLLVALLFVLRVGWTTPADYPRAFRILVLGYQLPADGQPAWVYRQRLERAWALLSASPTSQLFLLGGCARRDVMSEAAAGAIYLQTLGVPAERLCCEERSRHTLENLRLYRDAFPSGPVEATVLVSSRFHLARAGLMAAGLGLRCRLCAAEAKSAAILNQPGRVLIEAFFVHWYLVGCCFSRWTGNARMLSRVR
jgi:uncharacterized SAM-binding protein YcdF (DUF218 family)